MTVVYNLDKLLWRRSWVSRPLTDLYWTMRPGEYELLLHRLDNLDKLIIRTIIEKRDNEGNR